MESPRFEIIYNNKINEEETPDGLLDFHRSLNVNHIAAK